MLKCLSFYRNCCTYSTIKNLLHGDNVNYINKPLKIKGWLKSFRKYKKISFFHIDDGSTLQRLQIVIPTANCPKNLTYHTCLSLEGKLVKSEGNKQDIEFHAENLEVLNEGAPPDYPFVEKGTYLIEDQRLLPHFRVRSRDFASLLRIRSQTKMAMLEYFNNADFINIDTPILTSNDCEGGGEAFLVKGHGSIHGHDKEVDMGEGPFGHPVYLTVSGQLHLEAMASGLSKVYNFNPVFRGESGSRLHLNEFWMVEAEESFLTGENGYSVLMDRIEGLIKYTLKEIMNKGQEDVEFIQKFNKNEEFLEVEISKVLDKPFIRIEYKEALEILGDKQKLTSKQNFSKENELYLAEHFGGIPVYITHWPLSAKPFYMLTDEETSDNHWAFGVDLLVPRVGEIAGGGLREHRYEVLNKKIEDLGLTDTLKWYSDLRRWGYAPSGGFGLGFERFLQYFLGINNIRDTIPFPRGSGHCIC